MTITMTSILSSAPVSSQFLRSELIQERSQLVAELRYLKSYLPNEASPGTTRAMVCRVAECESKLIAVHRRINSL